MGEERVGTAKDMGFSGFPCGLCVPAVCCADPARAQLPGAHSLDGRIQRESQSPGAGAAGQGSVGCLPARPSWHVMAGHGGQQLAQLGQSLSFTT